jgi:hypothetical protein
LYCGNRTFCLATYCPGIGTQQPGRIQFESRRTITIEVRTSSSPSSSILSPIQSTKSRTGSESSTETICQTVCTGPKIDPDRIKVISFIAVRSEQAVDTRICAICTTIDFIGIPVFKFVAVRSEQVLYTSTEQVLNFQPFIPQQSNPIAAG